MSQPTITGLNIQNDYAIVYYSGILSQTDKKDIEQSIKMKYSKIVTVHYRYNKQNSGFTVQYV